MVFLFMQLILKGGYIMVNTNRIPTGVTEELAFTKEEIEELKAAREKPDCV